MNDINTNRNKQELLEMVAEVLQRNRTSRRRARTQRAIVSLHVKHRRTRTQRVEVEVSSYRGYDGRKVNARDFYPHDPSYYFTGEGSVLNYKKKRYARLRHRVSLIG